MLLQFIDFFIEWWLLKEPFVSSSVYQRLLLSNSSFKLLIFTLCEQLNTNIQGIPCCFLLPSWRICRLHYQAPVLHEVFRLLRVSKHLYTRGIPKQLSRRWPGPGPDSSQHLKLGYYALVCFLFCFAFFRLDKCERQLQLLCWCFESLIVCSNTTLLKLQTVLFLFFSKFCISKSGVRLIYGCSLFMDVYSILYLSNFHLQN